MSSVCWRQSRYSWFNCAFQLVASSRGHRPKWPRWPLGSHFGHWLLGGRHLSDPGGGHNLKHVSQLKSRRSELKIRPKLSDPPFENKKNTRYKLQSQELITGGENFWFDRCILYSKGNFSQTAMLEAFTTHPSVSGGAWGHFLILWKSLKEKNFWGHYTKWHNCKSLYYFYTSKKTKSVSSAVADYIRGHAVNFLTLQKAFT